MKRWYILAGMILLIGMGTMPVMAQKVIACKWSIKESKEVAETMIPDCLKRRWLSRFEQKNDGDAPIIVVGYIANKGREHIQIDAFIKDMEREFINDGSVRVLADREEVQELRVEKFDQQGNVAIGQAAEMAKELGANFMLVGTINTIVDQHKKEKNISYQVNLELHNIETREKVWIGDMTKTICCKKGKRRKCKD